MPQRDHAEGSKMLLRTLWIWQLQCGLIHGGCVYDSNTMKDIDRVMLNTLGKFLNQTAVFPCYSWKVQCILKLCKRYIVFYVKWRDALGSDNNKVFHPCKCLWIMWKLCGIWDNSLCHSFVTFIRGHIGSLSSHLLNISSTSNHDDNWNCPHEFPAHSLRNSIVPVESDCSRWWCPFSWIPYVHNVQICVLTRAPPTAFATLPPKCLKGTSNVMAKTESWFLPSWVSLPLNLVLLNLSIWVNIKSILLVSQVRSQGFILEHFFSHVP